VGNGLLMAIRRRRMDLDRLPRVLAELSTLAVEVDEAGAGDAWAAPLGQALTAGLTLYDALYLELAIRRELPLATFDAALRRAARIAGVRSVT
jgi:predicted nucleic acid-binding protein